MQQLPEKNPDPVNNSGFLELRGIGKSFPKKEGQELVVIKDTNFEMREGEIVALVGKSGSGKSTLLRIIAGLISPTTGEVVYRNEKVAGPVRGIAMVFQHFALMPWLNVLQNVELGLEAQGISRPERRKRALEAIDIIGLGGFESAYPKELSGGMRQRVGFARAMVVEPELLLMDEPFSALDVLTSENLISDLLDLWQERRGRLKGIIFVTHDIEEAAWLADRILIFNSDPGYIRAELPVHLSHPRNVQEPQFVALVDHIYTLMTTKPGAEGQLVPPEMRPKILGLGYRLPDTEVSELSGLLETLDQEYNGRCDLPELADALHMAIDDLFPLTEALEVLGFASTTHGDIVITPLGKTFANENIANQKTIFATQLLKNIPIARHIRRVLEERPGKRASKTRFLTELEDHFIEEEAERVLSTAIDWGRYAELFSYDNNSGMLSLEEDED